MSALLLLSHGELTPGRYVCLAVIDNGLDFEEGVARRLLEPFFTTRLEGTGLGLATVHEVVRDHDGAMNVQSKPGHGSRFEAWLPAATVQRCCRSGAARRCSSRANGNGCSETRRCWGAGIQAGAPGRCDRGVPVPRPAGSTSSWSVTLRRAGLTTSIMKRLRNWR
jgi:hypothetical protein